MRMQHKHNVSALKDSNFETLTKNRVFPGTLKVHWSLIKKI